VLRENVFEAEVREWLVLKMVTGRYSSILVKELVRHMEQRTANVFTIYDEIEALERQQTARASRTKAARQFRGATLRGLWHKHYFQAAFLLQNLRNHWPEPKMAALFETVIGDTTVAHHVRASRIAHGIVLEGYQTRAQAREMTGEWIIYAKHSGTNYYLTLADHGEGDAGNCGR
jgi:hypothetical protein